MAWVVDDVGVGRGAAERANRPGAEARPERPYVPTDRGRRRRDASGGAWQDAVGQERAGREGAEEKPRERRGDDRRRTLHDRGGVPMWPVTTVERQ